MLLEPLIITDSVCYHVSGRWQLSLCMAQPANVVVGMNGNPKFKF